ncbi:MAG: alpha-E domain-containing protein [Nitrosomonadales bacterium]|nr:alpha-E domain-containing protein [Nitrosomonadales bacterium]
MLARAAENLYWMARYLERAENTARLINSTTHVLLDLPLGATFGWANLIEVAGLDERFQQLYVEADTDRPSPPSEEAIMRFLIEDSRNPSSIFSCVQYARENTRTLREMLPAEMWERINSLYLYVRDNAAGACRSRRERYMVLNHIIEQRHAIVGLVSGTMAHDTAYQIIKLGRNVERADMTTRILDLNSAVEFPKDGVLHEALMERIWMSTLNSLSAYQTYRQLISMHVCSRDVIDFLLHDMRFPRSVEHCLCEIESCAKLLPKSKQLQQLTAQLRHKIAQHHTSELDALALHEYLDHLQAELGEIHNALTQQYFHAYQDSATVHASTQAEIEFAQQ